MCRRLASWRFLVGPQCCLLGDFPLCILSASVASEGQVRKLLPRRGTSNHAVQRRASKSPWGGIACGVDHSRGQFKPHRLGQGPNACLGSGWTRCNITFSRLLALLTPLSPFWPSVKAVCRLPKERAAATREARGGAAHAVNVLGRRPTHPDTRGAHGAGRAVCFRGFPRTVSPSFHKTTPLGPIALKRHNRAGMRSCSAL